MTQTYSNPITTTEFLRAMLPEPERSERIELRCITPAGEVHRRWAPSVADALDLARPLRRDHNVYVGVALRDGERGDAAHITRFAALWADIDAKCFADGEAGARRAIAIFSLPPSAVVATGNGLHAYWFLREPHDRDDGPRARAVMRGIAAALGAHARVPLDRVDDLARVLRLPNTLNLKGPEPKPVRVELFAPARRYDLSDFTGLGIEAAPPAGTRAGLRRDGSPLAITDGERNQTLARFGGLLRRYGLDAPAIAEALAAINRHHCIPPLPDGEVAAIAASAARYTPTVAVGTAPATRHVVEVL